jgi:hypothetical protein
VRLFAALFGAFALTFAGGGWGGRIEAAIAREAAESPRMVQPPAVLTALPAIGTVYWRADCAKERWAIGLKMFRRSATDRVTFRSGGRTLRRIVQPGETVWFPLTADKVQLLRVVQQTEPGTLSATVRVNFGIPKPGVATVAHCYSYAPPRVSVEIYPR